MTKEQVFNLLEKAISHIDEKFNSEERDIYLDSQLEDAQLPFEYSIGLPLRISMDNLIISESIA